MLGDGDRQVGWVLAFAERNAALPPYVGQLDKNDLNEVAGRENPTSENLAKWVWEKLKPVLPLLSKVVVHETCTCGAIYTG